MEAFFIYNLPMYTVYVLYSQVFNKIYIGFTSNMEERLRAHNELRKTGWTIRYRPWAILYTEIVDTRGNAMKREKELKSAYGRKFIWNMIREKGLDGNSKN
jgi:putative endonuclease